MIPEFLPWYLPPLLALAAGCLALAPLGMQVLQRGVVFIDLAVAQAAAAAALWGQVLLHWHHPLANLLAALAGALSCAALVAGLVRKQAEQREALIGLVYVVAASLAVLGARLDPHGHEKLVQMLAADVLWAGWREVGLLGGAALGLALLQQWRPTALAQDRFFYPVFACAASLAVPSLGLMVVFACLMAPALWARAGWRTAWVYLATLLAAAGGLALSWALDWPSGACVATMLGMFGLASSCRNPERTRL